MSDEPKVETPESSDPPRRLASDVILALEQKVDLIVKISASSELNNKLMLARLNTICSLLEKMTNQMVPPTEEVADPNAVFIDAEEKIEVETSPKGNRRTARAESYHIESPADGLRPIPVFQRVVDNAGKLVFMAEVEVLTESKELVAKFRTTNGGKWQGSLMPGKYIINIVRRENATRKRMEYSGLVEVQASDKPIELPQATIS